jgi:uncharacterized protein (TIGR03067 family)
MHAIIAATIFGGSAAFALMAERPSPDKPPVVNEQKAISSLDGAYTIVSGERDGKAIPEAEIKDAVVRFADGKVIGTDKARKEFFAASYVVDATKKPWKIDMKMVVAVKPDASEKPVEGAKASGLIKKEGDTLTIIYALPGGETPTNFKTKEKQQMFMLKTMASEPKLPNKFPSASPAPPNP